MIVLKTSEEIEKIRESCQLVAKFLSIAEAMIEPGVTTVELNKIATLFAHDHGAIPAFKGYKGFPYSICASKNDEVIHGMPSDKPLQEGDIISIDYGILLDGYYGDSAITVPVGNVSKKAELLIKTGQECLYNGIRAFCEGTRLNQISHAIQTTTEAQGYEPVRSYVGHGIGRNLHEEPQVKNFTRNPNGGYEMKRGTVIAIEPMILESKPGDLQQDKDGWTVRTVMGWLAVHWEHTAALTDKGTEILSIREGEHGI